MPSRSIACALITPRVGRDASHVIACVAATVALPGAAALATSVDPQSLWSTSLEVWYRDPTRSPPQLATATTATVAIGRCEPLSQRLCTAKET